MLYARPLCTGGRPMDPEKNPGPRWDRRSWGFAGYWVVCVCLLALVIARSAIVARDCNKRDEDAGEFYLETTRVYGTDVILRGALKIAYAGKIDPLD